MEFNTGCQMGNIKADSMDEAFAFYKTITMENILFYSNNGAFISGRRFQLYDNNTNYMVGPTGIKNRWVIYKIDNLNPL